MKMKTDWYLKLCQGNIDRTKRFDWKMWKGIDHTTGTCSRPLNVPHWFLYYQSLYDKADCTWTSTVHIVDRKDSIRPNNLSLVCLYLSLLINFDLLALIWSNVSIQYKNFHWANTAKTSPIFSYWPGGFQTVQ